MGHRTGAVGTKEKAGVLRRIPGPKVMLAKGQSPSEVARTLLPAQRTGAGREKCPRPSRPVNGGRWAVESAHS